MLQDFRYAVRTLAKRPALATAIVLTIGLGLGAAAAIVTASDAALVEPLPYADPERLVHLWEVRAGTDERSPTSYPTLLDWRARAHSFTDLEGYDPSNFIVGVGDGARMLRGAQVTAGFFRLLGVPISAGRDFLRNEDATTGAAVAIVTERLARSGAGGSALDQAIVVNGTTHTIVGVLPPAFHFALLGDADVFVPLVADEQRGADRFNRSIHVVGRLRDHVPLTSARAELSAVTAALAREHPDALAGRTVAALPMRDALLGNMKPILASLLAAVALLLVIMGANLALLMLTRYVARAPELAMRSALGATRRRVLRQLLVESLVPSVVGAALATAVGQVATRSLLRAIPEGVRIDMPYLTNVGLDARVIGVIMGLATLLAVGFGVGPALLITKLPGRAGDTRTTLALGRRRLRRTLAAAQVALTVVLLVAAGLLALCGRQPKLRKTARSRRRDGGSEVAPRHDRSGRVASGRRGGRRPGRCARCGFTSRGLPVSSPDTGEPHDPGAADPDGSRVRREPGARDRREPGRRGSSVRRDDARPAAERVEGRIQSPVSYDLVRRIRRGRAGAHARGAVRDLHARGADPAPRIRDSACVGRIAELDPALDTRRCHAAGRGGNRYRRDRRDSRLTRDPVGPVRRHRDRLAGVRRRGGGRAGVCVFGDPRAGAPSRRGDSQRRHARGVNAVRPAQPRPHTLLRPDGDPHPRPRHRSRDRGVHGGRRAPLAPAPRPRPGPRRRALGTSARPHLQLPVRAR